MSLTALACAAFVASPLDDIAVALLLKSLVKPRRETTATLCVNPTIHLENIMAAKQTTPSFDIAAFLATPATPKRSLFSLLGDKLENVTQRAGYRAGKMSEALAGTGVIFTLGATVGEVEAKVRTETFRARAAAEISAALQRMPG